jgi:hypothetical protein
LGLEVFTAAVLRFRKRIAEARDRMTGGLLPSCSCCEDYAK